ncbi:MAG: YhgE/Pip domain-containing protein [Ruminococcaceae bacterium]|nr:YhgE/Pip domain-containing protein [Oscillospiraceae bacterium]
MKTILAIFKRDLKNIFTNSMAIILAVGIALIPSMYAWFNIYNNWDPYGATGNMKVAVIIEDEGFRYKNIDIDVGKTIAENLKGNDAIDWQFVGKKEAMEGLEAGEYYAGIEIPKGFSESLTSIVSSKFEQPKIKYYANEKKNAIATKITDKVVETVQNEVNESFVTTVINVVTAMLGTVLDATDKEAVDVFGNLEGGIQQAITAIDNVQKTVGSFESVMKISDSLTKAVNNSQLDKIMKDSGTLVADAQEMADLIRSAVSHLTSSADSALSKVSGGLDSAAGTIRKIAGASAPEARKIAADVLAKLDTYTAHLENIKATLETIRDTLSIEIPALDKIINALSDSLTKLDVVKDVLTQIKDGAAQSLVNQITDDMDAVASNIGSVQSQYRAQVQPVLNENFSTIIDMLRATGSLVASLSGELPALQSLASGLDTSVKSGKDLVATLDKLLDNTKKQLKDLGKKIEGLKDNELVATITNVAGKNAEQLGAFLACPVQIDTEKVYGIENYGSAMAPFYSTLAIWVGGMVLVAVVKTEVKKKREIGNVKLHHAYFGRLFTFVLFAVVQALIICIGDLYFLKIQCYHPFLFILAGVMAAIAFSVFIFSVSTAFGDIGKAIGILFLVVQIGGAGGTFPIDVTPQFFRAIHPFLPFTFVINAMRECVCGTYGNDYWIDLLKLSAYIAIGLVIGLGVKFIVKKPIRFFEKQLIKTDLF